MNAKYAQWEFFLITSFFLKINSSPLFFCISNNYNLEMNNLLTEVIVQIVSHLSLSEKHNLAIACKQLHNTLADTALYNTITFKNINQINQALELCAKKDFSQ